MYRRETVELLKKLYEWFIVDPHDIDDEKYLFSKKFSEVIDTMIILPREHLLTNPDDVQSRKLHREECLNIA